MTQILKFFKNMWFLLFCAYISSVKSTEPYYDKSNETDISHCNYGMFKDHNFGFTCNCSRVIGNGPQCNINMTFNNTHYYMTEICLLDNSILWEKNLKILKERLEITRKDKDIITGIINEKTYIKVMYFCEKAYKKVYPVLRPTKETATMDGTGNKILLNRNEDTKISNFIASIRKILFLILGSIVFFIFIYILGNYNRIGNGIRSIFKKLKPILKIPTTTTVNIDSANINGVEDEKSIPTDRNHDSETPSELITLTETVHNSDHNSSQEETEENMDSPLENRGVEDEKFIPTDRNHDSETPREMTTLTESHLHPEHDSNLSENEDCEDPLLQNQKNSEIPTGNKNGER